MERMECDSGGDNGTRHQQQQLLLQRQRVVVVALGSRGDVQPLAIIAERMARGGEVAVSLVSHGELLWLCERVAPGVEQRPLKASCFLGDSHDLENPLCVVDTRGRRRREWVQVCEAARDADLIVSNLFGMPPCIHLAEKLDVALLVCSPSLIPYVLPTSFEADFRDEFPEIYEHISGGKSCVMWEEVLEWMWPIFTEAHGALREHLLHLPNIPFLDAETNISKSSESSAADEEKEKEEFPAVADPWVAAPRLFIGIDGVLLEHARLERLSDSGWGLPASATVCAPWELADSGREPAPGEWPFEEGERPVFVTFGSMGRHELVDNAQGVLDSISEALTACGARGAVQWPPRSVGEEGDRDRGTWPQNLVRVPVDVSYPWAFGRCRAVLHHGGVGTTTECIRAGVPQVIFPLAFDQPFWGRVVERAGVGVCASGVREIGNALQKALGGDVIERARSCKRRVSGDGADLVCSAAMENLSTKHRHEHQQHQQHRGGRADNRWRRDKGLDLREPIHMKTEGMKHLRCMNVSEADWIAKEVFVERVYTPEGIRSWPGMRVVDIGGSIGLFAIFAKKCLCASSVLVVEPARGSWQLCEENLGASFGEGHGVEMHRCACGAQDGTAEFVYFPELPSNSCLSRFEADKRVHASSEGCFNQFVVDYLFAGEKREVVQMRRLSGLLQREHRGGPALDVSLLKIDVEGGEAQVLLGIDERDWGSIHQLAMEVHSDELLAECLALVKPHFSRVWNHRQAIPGHHMLYAARGPGPGASSKAPLAPSPCH